jgi:hypothetical protein
VDGATEEVAVPVDVVTLNVSVGALASVSEI